MEESSNPKLYSFAKSMKSFPQNKIELDTMEKEKKTSFATLGRNSSGISITFSDDKDEFSKSRRGSMKDQQSRSGPGTPSRSRGISPNMTEEDMGSQLLSVRMKLEERRKRIEEEKKKMEMIMSKQREKVGQEAFLRAVAKGIKKAGHKEGGEGARTEILELASRVGEKPGGQRACRPFSLHLENSPSPSTSGGSQSQAVSTPDMEANSISRMSDSLYELQSDLQRLALQQSQIQTMMSSSPHPHPAKPEHPPFFISQQPPSPPHPFYISNPSQQYFSRPTWPAQAGYHPPPPTLYEQHHPPPHHPYIDQYGRQWGGHNIANLSIPPSSHNHTMQIPNHHPPYTTYNPNHNQTYPPPHQPPQPYQSPGYPQSHPYPSPTPPSYLPPKYSESSETPPDSHGSPFRGSLSRSSSLKRSVTRSPYPDSVSRNSAGMESRTSSSFLDTSDSNIDLNSTGSSQELMVPQQISFRDVPSPSPPPRISLIPQEPQKPPPRSEKPSLSTTFLEQKRKTLQANQGCSLSSQVMTSSPKPNIPPPTSPIKSSPSTSPSPSLELTQSTIDTLSTMKTQELKESSEHAKGFVISFDTSTPVKPKPLLKPRRSSKKIEDYGEDSVIGGVDTAQEVSEMDTVTFGDMSNNSIVIDEPSSNSVVATPDSEERSGAEEICCICEVRVGLINISAVIVCESCNNFFQSVGNSVGEDISCVEGLNKCSFGSLDTESWCKRCWSDKAVSLELGTGESELVEKKKEWVMMMTVKRKQQAEESRMKREEESRKRREEEENKKEELLRKKEDDKKRREEIFEAYKLKKEAEKAKEEGRNFFSAKPGPKLRPKSAGGSRPRPRPNTIHVDHKDEVGINTSKMRGSQSNIAVSSGGFRTLGRVGVGGCRRGSNASLHDESDGGVWGGSLRGLGHIGRSKSSSASNLGPGSLPLGIRHRAARDFDDNASDVSSTTSGYRSGRGSAKLFREPVSKSNRPIIMNAVEYVVFPGVVNKETRTRVLEEIERCECPHFLILFRDSKLQFRGLYAYYPDTEEVFKIYGVGPRQVGDSMMDGYYKYNSGGKKFTQIHTKHLTVTIDGFTIHNSLWLGKKTKLPDKKDMALVI